MRSKWTQLIENGKRQTTGNDLKIEGECFFKNNLKLHCCLIKWASLLSIFEGQKYYDLF